MYAKNANVVLKVVIGLVVVAAIAFAALTGFRKTAVVAPVKLGRAVNAVAGSVTVHADKDVQALKSEASGRVDWCEALDPGKPFKKGDVLVKLDARELELSIANAKREYEAAVQKAEIERSNDPRLKLAERALENGKRLHALGRLSDEGLQELERALNTVKTQLQLSDLTEKKAKADYDAKMEGLNLSLEKMTIRAPSDGSTREVMIAPGSLIGNGQTVATFFANERVVVAKVGEESFGEIRVGNPAKVRLLIYGLQEFDAKVVKILPFADEQTQRYTVHLEVDLAPEKLIPFSTGEATITVGERENQPLMPRRALFNTDNVFVVKDGRVERRKVEVGFVGLDIVEIRKGLAPGDQVIVENLEQFRDGQRVSTVEAKGE